MGGGVWRVEYRAGSDQQQPTGQRNSAVQTVGNTVRLAGGTYAGKSFTVHPGKVRAVEDRTRTLLQRMEVREPFTMRQLIERYCACTGAKVILMERLLPVDCFFAITLKVSTGPDGYVIAYQQATSRWHQDHGIGHEFGHIIAGHYEVPNLTRHSMMSAEMEWEAEYIANLLARWSYQVGRVLDRRQALRPLRRAEDLSVPLQERMGWL